MRANMNDLIVSVARCLVDRHDYVPVFFYNVLLKPVGQPFVENLNAIL
jgi:hypothetical protein